MGVAGGLDPSLFAAATFAPNAAAGAVDRKVAAAAAVAVGPSNSPGLPPTITPTPAPMLMPTPAMPTPPQPAPMDVGWHKLCLQMEGMLMSGPTLQIGFKGDFRSHAARVGIYLGNVASQPLQGLAVELIVPPATQPALVASAAAVQDQLAPRAQALQMVSLELLAPFAQPPVLSVTWKGGGDSGAAGGGAVHLPVFPMRFITPWPLGKDDYFRLWRGDGLSESQSKFTFAASVETAAIKAVLGTNVRLAVLEGVDPSPTNLCAAGALACKGGATPPAPGGHFCLVRLEIVPNHTAGSDGMKRSASRLTVRATSATIGDGLVAALTAHIAGVLPGK